MNFPLKNTNHYTINLKIAPQEQFLDARVALALHAPANGISHAEFFLHNQLVVAKVMGQKLAGYRFDQDSPSSIPYLPECGVITLEFSEPLEKGERIELEFEYRGKITKWPEWSANIISDEWTELGLYFPWFPYHPDDGDLTFSLDVECDPVYRMCSYGECVRHGDTWHTEWDQPTNDIVIALGKKLDKQSIQEENRVVRVNSVTLSQSTANMMLKDVSSILTCYAKWFSDQVPSQVSIIQSPREKGGGYTRRGLIVLGGLHDQQFVERREAYSRYLGHEIAHLWWWKAETTSWEDWLNESLAEYSALMIVREFFGQDSFDKRLADKQKTIEDTVPIWGFNRTDYSTKEKMKETEIILYNKGPVLLYELETRIGQKRFRAVCRQLISQNIASTHSFLQVLRGWEGDQVGDWMEKSLKTR